MKTLLPLCVIAIASSFTTPSVALKMMNTDHMPPVERPHTLKMSDQAILKRVESQGKLSKGAKDYVKMLWELKGQRKLNPEQKNITTALLKNKNYFGMVMGH